MALLQTQMALSIHIDGVLLNRFLDKSSCFSPPNTDGAVANTNGALDLHRWRTNAAEHRWRCFTVSSIPIHIGQYLFHRRLPYRFREEFSFELRGRDHAQQRQQQQQATEPGGGRAVGGPRVRHQHHLRLVLQVLDLERVFETARFCKSNLIIS